MSDNNNIQVIVRGESASATRLNLTAGKFKLVIDEPESLGGTDAGPTPVQVLLMALAGCLNVTGHAVARQQGIDIQGLRIKIEGSLNPDAFMGRSFEARAGFQHIQVTIIADALSVTEEDLSAWLEETEKRCPVTDNIYHETEIDITVERT